MPTCTARSTDGGWRCWSARSSAAGAINAGGTLDFLPETAEIRADSWQVAPPAPGLIDRRVEITGPTDAKMTINALNSGAKVWMADFEDANTPLWENMVGGQLNLRARYRRHAATSPPRREALHAPVAIGAADDRGAAARLAPVRRSTC